MADWSQGAQGALGGAGVGASIGSVIPVVGTGLGAGIGALGGGLTGLFGGGGADDQRRQLEEYAKMVQGRGAPQMGPAATAGQSPYEAQRGAFLQQLQGWANGQGPSAAAQQMRDSMDRSAASQQGMAAGVAMRGGGGAGAAARNAMTNTAALQGQSARDTGILRSQEQMGAMNQYGLALQGANGQQNDLAMFNATQQNNNAQANLAAKLKMLGITDEATIQAIMASMSGAGPGVGTQLLAGGASVFPSIAGAQAANKGAGGAGPGLYGGQYAVRPQGA